MKKVLFLFISFFFTKTIFSQTEKVHSYEKILKLVGKGKTDIEIDDTTVRTIRVKKNGKTLKIKDFGIKSILKKNATVSSFLETDKKQDNKYFSDSVKTNFVSVKAKDTIFFKGDLYAIYTGSESPASSPNVPKKGFILMDGKWYKIIDYVFIKGKKYTIFYPTADEHPTDEKGNIKLGYEYKDGKWYKESN